MATVVTPLTFIHVAQQMSIYVYIGFFSLITGFIGGILVLVVFLSLKTFRENSCAFYLMIKSVGNICYLAIGLFPFIINIGFGINWANMSIIYCKFRIFYVQLGSLVSVTCTCLAAIDQFLATCSNTRWHRWNTINIAHKMVIGIVIVWSLYGIVPVVLYTHVQSPMTGRIICGTTNTIFLKFYSQVHVPLILSSLPAAIMTIFGLLAYRNVRNIAYRTVPLVRRELDKQLTSMVLVQVVYDVVFALIIIAQTILYTLISTATNPYTIAMIDFISTLSTLIYYFDYVGSFYIYVCISKRFRQQLIHVLFTIHFNRCRQLTNNNQIEPQA